MPIPETRISASFRAIAAMLWPSESAMHKAWVINSSSFASEAAAPSTPGGVSPEPLNAGSGAEVKVSRSYRDVVARFVH